MFTRGDQLPPHLQYYGRYSLTKEVKEENMSSIKSRVMKPSGNFSSIFLSKDSYFASTRRSKKSQSHEWQRFPVSGDAGRDKPKQIEQEERKQYTEKSLRCKSLILFL